MIVWGNISRDGTAVSYVNAAFLPTLADLPVQLHQKN